LPPHLCHEAPNAGPTTRAQLAVLNTFFHGLPFVHMAPSVAWISHKARAGAPPLDGHVQGLLLANGSRPYPYDGFFAAAFLAVRGVAALEVHLDAGRCTGVQVEWVDTLHGNATLALVPPTPSATVRELRVPPYEDDVAFRLSCLA
jgi:hypothetical protein